MAFKRVCTAVAGMMLAFGALTACGGESSQPGGTTTTTTATAAALPQSATFTASMPGKDGGPPMAMAINVEGDKVVAYACNGTNDAAWFRGTQKDGTMELTSDYLDTLKATFDGTNLNATVTMNDMTMTMMAQPASPPAGMYTMTDGDARASWVVLPDQTMLGVVQPNSTNDREVIDQINKQQQDFKDRVRQARLNRQMQQAPAMAYGSWTAMMNGRSVTAVPVNATMSSLPNTN